MSAGLDMPKQEVAQTKIFLIKGKLTILLLGFLFFFFFWWKWRNWENWMWISNIVAVFLYLIVLLIVLQVSCWSTSSRFVGASKQYSLKGIRVMSVCEWAAAKLAWFVCDFKNLSFLIEGTVGENRLHSWCDYWTEEVWWTSSRVCIFRTTTFCWYRGKKEKMFMQM